MVKLAVQPEVEKKINFEKEDLPELLSPAGSFEAVIAAVENGADAVYLGLKNFNARRQAENFDFKELKEAVDYAHSKGTKVYLAFNILIKNSELRGNRGLCTQPCRLSYELWSKKGREKTIGPYLLSTSELITLIKLKDLWRGGVRALKIEGRMRSSEYVAAATRVYREALDKLKKGEGEDLFSLKKKVEVLEEVFNRGFNCSYLEGESGNELMSYNRPNHRGIFLGGVTFVNHYTGEVGLRLRRALSVGDEVEFWVKERGRVALKVEKIKVDAEERIQAAEGERAVLFPTEGRKKIKVGDRVFRKYNAHLVMEIRKSYIRKVHMKERAQGESFEKRRKIKVSLKEIKFPELKRRLSPKVYLAVSTSNLDTAREALRAGADWIYFNLIPFSGERRGKKELIVFLEEARGKSCEIAFRIPNVWREKEKLVLNKDALSYVSAFVVDNFGQILVLERYKLPFILDYHLYAFNSFSAHFFKEHEISRITASLELSLEEIVELSSHLIFPLEYPVHGFPEVMISEHCVLQARRGKGCEEYCFKNEMFKLRDRKGYFFPVKTDIHCRSHVFNSRSLCLYAHLNQLYQAGIRYFRIFLENFSPEEAGNIVRVYKNGLLKVSKGEKVELKEVKKLHPTFSRFTTGHLFRGVI